MAPEASGAATVAPTERHESWRPPYGGPWVYVLSVIDGPDPGQTHRIVRAETVIGRGPEADFRIDEERISKRHCLIRTEGGVCTLTDLGSLNGTLLNNRPLEKGVAKRLRHLDEICVGEVRLFVMTGKYKPRLKSPAP